MRIDENDMARLVEVLGSNARVGAMKRRVCAMLDEIWAEKHGLHEYANLIEEWYEERGRDHFHFFDIEYGPLSDYREMPYFRLILKVTLDSMVRRGYLKRASEPYCFKTA